MSSEAFHLPLYIWIHLYIYDVFVPRSRYKFFVSSDSPFGFDGWSDQNNTMIHAKSGIAPTCQNCLFDILNDPTETKDISGCVGLYSLGLALRAASVLRTAGPMWECMPMPRERGR